MKQEEIDRLKYLRERIKAEEQHHMDTMLLLSNEVHKLRCSCDHKNPDGTDAKREWHSVACPFDEGAACNICGADGGKTNALRNHRIW